MKSRRMLGGCVAALLSVVLLIAGCGGGSTIYTRDATAACLGENGSIVSTDSKDLDYLAQDAGAGAIDGTVDSRDYTLSFERTVNDAKRTLAAYKVFGSAADDAFGADAPIDDVLSRESNVVVIWDDEPTDRYGDYIRRCLK